ncbi:unnamed protein product [Protopolystoma xenopodis]|uniref:Uncharacterized protein n=1 Tax=Protopolystoma xenopodis TaxID=117903 RepID=A0A448XCU2_9PLAT|nr:unnamed protein product [Protopolystoma xenopodis]
MAQIQEGLHVLQEECPGLLTGRATGIPTPAPTAPSSVSATSATADGGTEGTNNSTAVTSVRPSDASVADTIGSVTGTGTATATEGSSAEHSGPSSQSELATLLASMLNMMAITNLPANEQSLVAGQTGAGTTGLFGQVNI